MTAPAWFELPDRRPPATPPARPVDEDFAIHRRPLLRRRAIPFARGLTYAELCQRLAEGHYLP